MIFSSTSSSRRGAFGHTGTTTVSSNAALIYNASGDAPLFIVGPLAINGGEP